MIQMTNNIQNVNSYSKEDAEPSNEAGKLAAEWKLQGYV